METYCVSCKKYTENENSNVRKTKQNWLMLLSNCAVYGKNFYLLICKNQLLLKIKNSTILINLKWIKSLTKFYWLATNLSQNYI